MIECTKLYGQASITDICINDICTITGYPNYGHMLDDRHDKQRLRSSRARACYAATSPKIPDIQLFTSCSRIESTEFRQSNLHLGLFAPLPVERQACRSGWGSGCRPGVGHG